MVRGETPGRFLACKERTPFYKMGIGVASIGKKSTAFSFLPAGGNLQLTDKYTEASFLFTLPGLPFFGLSLSRQKQHVKRILGKSHLFCSIHIVVFQVV